MWETSGARACLIFGLSFALSTGSSLFPPQTRSDGVAFQLAKGVGGDPAGGTGIQFAHAERGADGGAIEAQIALADVAKSPIDGLADEIAIVARFAQQEGQHFLVLGVRCVLIAISEIGY